jgi:uncharacterized membrane protein YccC
LAILLGRYLSETRYYWAVVATIVVFSGTATRSETAFKAADRVVGTVLGLGVAIGLADLTTGHFLPSLAVIVACTTFGFYVATISYAGIIFFFTIVVAQLYSLLGQFTPHLLELRFEETALGAGIGILVSLLVLPTSTRDTLKAAEHAFLDSVTSVLHAVATALDAAPSQHVADGGVADTVPMAQVRAMDERLRRLAKTSLPMTSLEVFGNKSSHVRRRLTLHAAVAHRARALAAVPASSQASGSLTLNERADAYRALADIINDAKKDAAPR